MKRNGFYVVGISLLLGALSTQAQSLSPLKIFGGGDGWLAPGEGGYAYLTTGNTERGLAFGNGHLYLVSRANVGGNTVNIRILDPLTGTDLGSLSAPSSIIAGGTFPINTIRVGGDGAIYVNNLTTGDASGSPFKIYSWANESANPTVAYNSGGTLLAGGRVGDSLAVIGRGSSTLLAAGFGSSPAVTGNNGFGIIDPTAGTATAVAFAGTPPNAGDFRLGISFTDNSHVIGAQGSSIYRYTSFVGTTGTLLGSPTIPDPAGATADRLLAYNVVGGRTLLAVGSIGDFHISLYDVSDPSNPVYLASANNTSGTLTANGNGTGQLTWGPATYNVDGTFSADLYALSSNQGIQAFIVTIPEPGLLTLAALGLGLLALARRGRK